MLITKKERLNLLLSAGNTGGKDLHVAFLPDLRDRSLKKTPQLG
jgi:hypothetical protein